MDEPTPTVDAPSKPLQRFRRTRIAVSVFFGVLTAWGLGFVSSFLTIKIYDSYYYPGDPDPVYFDDVIAGLIAWLLVGMIGTVLVIREHVRGRYLSLRTMLIASTLVAVVLGLAVWTGR